MKAIMPFVGPSLEEGPLPAVIYFALSQEESLYQDPYNQPVVYLQEKRMRIFSLSLPAHGPGLKAQEAMNVWAKDYTEGKDPLRFFLDSAELAIKKLIDEEIASSIGLMGLSRGGLICGHLALRLPDIKAWVAFAPLTKLTGAMEFQTLQENPLVKSYNLEMLASSLATKPVRFYISNRDTRVGTRNCFDLVEKLSNEAYAQGVRSPPIELLIGPPHGLMGHGTLKDIFCAGAQWIAEKLGMR